MVSLEYKGYVSGVYVYTSIAVLISLSAFCSGFVWLFNSAAVALINFVLVLAFLLLLYPLRAMKAYQRVRLNSDGVRCGKLFVKYEDISNATIVQGYVRERYGFAFIEDNFGKSQSEEIYIENLLCINCKFEGMSRKTLKKCIYVPINKKTDEILRAHCKEYRQAILQAQSPADEYRRNSKEFLRSALAASVASIVLSLFVVLLAYNGSAPIYKTVFTSVFAFAFPFLAVFKGDVTAFLSKTIAKKCERNFKDRK